jgi:SNF2 family DNA or RNA helicase
MLAEAHWCRENDQVDLRQPSGERLHLSAMEIFQAVFGGVRRLRGFSFADPAIELKDVHFSRFPADAAIRVFETPGALGVEIGVSAGETFAPVVDSTDQLISNNSWFPLQREDLEATRTWAASVGVRENASLTIGSLIALRTRADRPARLLDEVFATSGSIASGHGKVPFNIPGISAVLYTYQAEGVGFLRLIAEQGVGCVLADEMGLGKTLQVIALLQAEKNAGRSPSLVVAPATLLENWRREFRNFAPGLTVHVHAGSDRPGIAQHLRTFDITVVSYDTAIRDEPMLASVVWNVIALDEAQNIKNPAALRTCTVKRLPRRVSIAVTGTPLENRVDDLWSITDFALPGLLGSLENFQHAFSDSVDDASRIAPLIAPAILRRRVLEVAKDLPRKIEIPQPLRMTNRLAVGYEALRKKTLDDYGASAQMVALTKLRMYCTHPSIPDVWDPDPALEMPKYARLLEILEEVFGAGEKALVFSSYKGMADLLARDLPRRFPAGYFRTIDGRLAVPERQPTVDGFFDHPGCGALILNPKAAGVGLNITAANHVIHYNPEWNPAITDQATARAFRRKQRRPVTVHHLYFVGTVEEVMMDRAAFKRALADEAVTGHEGDVDPLALARALQISPLTRAEESSPL